MHFNDAYSQDLTAAAVVTVAVAAVVGAAVFAAVVVAAAVTIFQSISSLLLHDTKQIKKHRGHIKHCFRYVALIFSTN